MDDWTIERFNEILPVTHNKVSFGLVVSEAL